MQGTHERAAGEWQAEWDALPLICAAAAGALAGARAVLAGLAVFPERMRANLDAEGGSIMAEAAMMAVADAVGRAEAHALVSEASSAARREGVSLQEALERVLAPEILEAVGPLADVLDPASYLGETDAIVDGGARGLGARHLRRRLAAGRLEQLDRDAVGILQVEPEATAVDARVDLDGRGDERRHPTCEQILVQRGEVGDEEAQVRGADVARLDVGTLARGREVLEQLDHVAVAGDAEMRHAHVRIRVADDRREIATFLLLRRDHLATEDVAVEDERAVEVGDRVARVVRAG